MIDNNSNTEVDNNISYSSYLGDNYFSNNSNK